MGGEIEGYFETEKIFSGKPLPFVCHYDYLNENKKFGYDILITALMTAVLVYINRISDSKNSPAPGNTGQNSEKMRSAIIYIQESIPLRSALKKPDIIIFLILRENTVNFTAKPFFTMFPHIISLINSFL